MASAASFAARGGRRAAPEGRREEKEDAAKKKRKPPALSPRFHRRRPQRRLVAAALRARMPSCEQWRDRGRDGGGGGAAWGKKRSRVAAYPWAPAPADERERMNERREGDEGNLVQNVWETHPRGKQWYISDKTWIVMVYLWIGEL
jgi:hypothetical protein